MIFNTLLKRTIGAGGDGGVVEGELFLTADGEEFLTADDEQFAVAFQDRLVDVDKFPTPPNEKVVYKRIVPKVVDGIYRVTGSGEIRNFTQTNATYNYLIVDDHTAVKEPVASDGETYTWYIDSTGIWYYVNDTWYDKLSEYDGEVYRGLLYDNPYTATLSYASWYVYVSEVEVSYGVPTEETEIWKYADKVDKAFMYIALSGGTIDLIMYFNYAFGEQGVKLLGYKVVNSESEIDKSDTGYVYVVKPASTAFAFMGDEWQTIPFTEVENMASIPPSGEGYYCYYRFSKQWGSLDTDINNLNAEISNLKEKLSEADGAKNFMSYAQLTTFANGIELDNITNRNISAIEIHPSISKIGYSSFNGCKNLTSVVIPDNVIEIDNYAFEGCTSLKSLELGDSLTTIGVEAFENCTSLTSVVIGDSVTSIGYATFRNCTSLTSVEIPNSVTSMGNEAFRNCTSLISVVIGNSVPMIDSWTFGGCTSLTSVVMPSSVTEIGVSAFRDCTNLTDITYNGTQTKWNSITKGADWDTNTGNYTIHCTDGDIAKQ